MAYDRGRLWAAVVLAIALGAALRLYFVGHAAIISGDTFLYGDIALSWMQHGVYGFSQPPLEPLPTLIRLPGYPIFLILCFRLFGPEHYTAVLLLQSVIDLLAALIFADLVRRLFGPKPAIAALFLAALCPFTASYAAAALTETLTLASITLAFYALERWRPPAPRCPSPSPWTHWNRWLWVLALALACSLLLRPEQGLLAVAILPAIFAYARRASPGGTISRSAAPALVALFCTLLPLLPWTVRNARTFHVFEPLAPRSATDPGDPTPHGFNRWYRTWAIDFASTEDIYWNYDGAPIQFADIPARAFDSPAQLAQTSSILRDYNATAKPSPEIEAGFNSLALDRIHAHPVRCYVGLPLARLTNMLLRPRVEMLPIPLSWWRWREHPKKTALALAFGALNLAYLLGGALGLYRWCRRRKDTAAPIAWSMIAFIALRCALLLTLDNSEPRYTLELFPLLIVGIAFLARDSKTSRIV